VVDLAEIVGQSKARTQLGIFQVQFGKNVLFRKEKRGQQPFVGDCEALRDCMCAYSPPILDIPRSHAYAVLTKATTSVSMFGLFPDCVVNGELERQGLPSLRYQIKGSRLISCVPFDDIAKFMQSKSISLEVDMLAVIRDTFDSMDDETFGQFCALSPKVYRMKLEPGMLFYVPFGYYVFEKVLSNDFVYGLRTASFNGTSATIFANQYKAYSKSASHEPTLLKFWLNVLSLTAPTEHAALTAVDTAGAETGKNGKDENQKDD
jgi:hypothetical protein